MKVLGKIIRYFFIVFLVVGGSFLLVRQTDISTKKYQQKIFSCQTPITYSIGRIDPQFGISQENFIRVVSLAEIFWEEPTGRNLFKYDFESQFKINLIYDERQVQTVESGKLEEELAQLETAQKKITAQYNSLQSDYQKKKLQYEKDLKEYQKEIKKFNEEVAYWNKKGGAPEDEYEDLKKKEEKLEKMGKNLEKERQEVNALAQKTNKLVSQEEKIVASYNSNLKTYNNKFGGTQEFEKGVFDGKEINIYQFKELSDLRLTLAHELGHYLGMDHVQNSLSIMYYLMGDQDLENPIPTKEDMNELNKVCKIQSD
ncbi:MAG: hypothetical protein COZ85_00040 [Candidatus Moranbacteria bacterium CG_4_8_14_3_um_filter_34_16]|nr:MAG: hypothetical protein COZ85_00040 [Candidatus Moranbacteria bacterium CG_4_8_14_3_um_filter_34_16]PJA89063.1 MAG: hypothetical protein CO138_02485 [Candidatus Moranbacteria bacterium CG_4_9_14_3_um_filter_33_15]